MTAPAIIATTASSQFSGLFPGSNATNRTFSSYWVAGAATGWLRVQLASAYVSTGYRILSNYNEASRAPKSWTFEGSNDGSTWDVLDTQTDVPTWQGVNAFELRAYDIANSTAYEYYRLNVSANHGNTYLAIAEFYPDAAPVDPGADPYPAEVMADSPTVYIRGSETAGSVAEDVSGNGFQAAMAGTYTRDGASLLTVADPSITFTAGHGRIPTASALNDTSAITLEALVHITSVGALRMIWNRDDESGSRCWQFRVTATGALDFLWWNASGGGPYSVTSAASQIAADTTYHLAVTYDGSVARLYRDGTQIASTAQAGTIRATSPDARAVYFGSTRTFGQPLVGRGDEFAYYSGVALSAARIAAHAAAVTAEAGPPSGAGSGSFSWAGSAAGSADYRGVGSGSFSWAGAGSGVTPLLVPTGSGTGAFAWAGAAAGSTEKSGSGSGAFAWSGDAEGTNGTAPTGSGSGSFSWTAGTTWGPISPRPTGQNLPAPTPVNVAVALPPTPAPVPAGITARTIELAAQPMPTLSADLARVTGLDYSAPASVPYGRLAVFFDGIDVTHLRDVPCRIDSWSSARPSGDTAARVSFPQIAPWDEFGTGDLAPFRKDAAVEIGILRADDSFDILWEGYWASEGDATGEAREDTTLDCEGTFWQADHTIHIPALHLEPTDIGILIARALNAVPGRRYAALPEVTTGILSRERGSQTQSVLAYVQDLLSTAWTENGRQWTLARVAPYTYRLQLTDITTVHGTITKGAWGVEIDLARDESTRVDAVYCRGVAPSGGVWANWFWPGLDLYTPPPYLYASPATNMTPGATDAGTLTGSGVSDWQRRVVEMGYNLTVTGTHDAASVAAARWVQQQRGILVDGHVGPQTWNATWDVGAQALDLTAIRLPLAWKPETERHLYTANGAVAGDNPAWNPGLVRRSVDLNFGPDVSKSAARPLAQRYLEMYGEAAWTGRVTLSTDTHEGISRLEYREGMNLRILGHDGAPLLVQIADAEHGEITSTFTVDERARDAMAVDAILARDRDARRTPAARPGNPTKLAQLDRNQIVQYEDESKAGVVPRLAINGSVGLWTVVPIFVSQTGSVAKMTFQTSSPATTYCIAIYGRPITANQQAAFVPNPLTNGDGWRDHEVELLTRFGWIDTWGEPGSRAGYSPWQESDGRAVTGKLTDDAGFPFVSEFGGYLWVAIYAAVDCFIEGRLYPGVPQ